MHKHQGTHFRDFSLLLIWIFNKNENLKGHINDMGQLGEKAWSDSALAWKSFV